MSLILTWDNPQSTFDKPVCHRVDIWRGRPDPFSSQRPAAEDITWGCFEDCSERNPMQEYAVVYVGQQGEWQTVVYNFDIKRYIRPDNTCRIEFALTAPDGAPDSGRDIEISDEYDGARFYRRLVTNLHGQAITFGKQGQRLLLRIDGRPKALDFIVPRLSRIEWPELKKFGTEIDTDQRGFM